MTTSLFRVLLTNERDSLDHRCHLLPARVWMEFYSHVSGVVRWCEEDLCLRIPN